MKLSTRNELLNEADDILSSIKSNIVHNNKKNISENVGYDFFNNLIKSIAGSISIWIKSKKQNYLYKKLPYLMGIDLINRNEIKIDQKKLKILNQLISEIIRDIRKSPKLNQSMKELESADLEWMRQRQLLNYYTSSPEMCQKDKYHIKTCKELPVNLKKARDNYYSILNSKIVNIIEDIIKSGNYRSFDDKVISTIKSGISGLTQGEIEKIKNNYLNVIADRAARFVDIYDISHNLTSKEESEYFRQSGLEATAYDLPFGWKRSQFGKKGETG